LARKPLNYIEINPQSKELHIFLQNSSILTEINPPFHCLTSLPLCASPPREPAVMPSACRSARQPSPFASLLKLRLVARAFGLLGIATSGAAIPEGYRQNNNCY
jgi:hypothetical protein